MFVILERAGSFRLESMAFWYSEIGRRKSRGLLVIAV